VLQATFDQPSPLSALPEWRALRAHAEAMRGVRIRDLLDADPERATRYTLDAAGLGLDYARHRATDQTLRLLLALARARGLRTHIDAMFRGEVVNISEDRPALHTALRAPHSASVLVDGHDVIPDVHAVLDQMRAFAGRVRSGEWAGHTGRPIRAIVHLGIGGSDLGPRMAVEALRSYADRALTIRFVANADPADLTEALRDLDPAETLCIVASKSFTTPETMANAHAARAWLLAALGDQAAVARHFVAVSTNLDAVARFGIDPTNVFTFWDWVGGRTSLCSAIGLPLMLAIGPAHFDDLLAGAHAMDEHFRRAPFDRNMPALMGLLGVWYTSLLGAETVCIVPYEQSLASFPAYLQQLAMESNGKRTAAGRPVHVPTGPIVWGAVGTNAQHSFFQLLHQGTHIVPVDLIGFARGESNEADRDAHRDLLLANLVAQAEALARGDDAAEGDRHVAGNQPVSVLLADRLTPRTLGALVALYEHVVFTQATIWGIDPFDQWGVELGKRIAADVLPALADGAAPHLDASARALIDRIRALRGLPPH